MGAGNFRAGIDRFVFDLHTGRLDWLNGFGAFDLSFLAAQILVGFWGCSCLSGIRALSLFTGLSLASCRHSPRGARAKRTKKSLESESFDLRRKSGGWFRLWAKYPRDHQIL